MVITAYLLFASVFDEEKWAEGYRWVYSQLKGTHAILVSQIKTEQAVKHLKRKYFDSAVKLLKGFDKKEADVRAIVATNIYLCTFLR